MGRVRNALVRTKILYNSEQVTVVAQYIGLKRPCTSPQRYKNVAKIEQQKKLNEFCGVDRHLVLEARQESQKAGKTSWSYRSHYLCAVKLF